MKIIKLLDFRCFLLLLLSVFIFPLSADDTDLDEDFGIDYLFFESTNLTIEAESVADFRSFDDVFPGFTDSQKRRVMSNVGLRHSFEKGGTPAYTPSPSTRIDPFSDVMKKNPSHIIEALIVVPYNTRELDLIDIYNALGRIGNLKDQTIPQRNGRRMNVFTNTTRLISASNRRAIPDPPPTTRVPYSETMFLRFTDAYIGDLFIRGDMSLSLYGMNYNMTNFRDINFTIFRIMRSERVSINLYLEPVKEGILIYSVSGIYLPDFIMNRMNLTPNINNRINCIVGWITEGLRVQETIRLERVRTPTGPTATDLIQSDDFNRLLNN